MQNPILPLPAISALNYFPKAIKKCAPILAILCLGLLTANSTLAHGSLHDVIERKSRLIEQSPDDALSLFERGMLYQKHEEIGLALADFHRALQLEPHYYVCHLPLSELYLKKGRVRKALYHINALLNKEPDNPFAYQARASVYQAMGWKARAVSDLRRLIALKNDEAIRPQDYVQLSEAILQAAPRNYDGAISVLEEGLARLGNLISFQSRIVELEMENQHCTAALERIGQIMEPLERKEKWLIKKAQILERNGQPEEAYEAYRQAREEARVLNNSKAHPANASTVSLHNAGPTTGAAPPLLSGNAMLLVTRGPYLQMGTPASMVIKWRTDLATDSKVWYGLTPTNLNMTAAVPGARADHEVTVSGLAPNTRYYYAIGEEAGILAGGTVNHFFQTSPSPGTTQTVRAWVLGDCGTGNDNARAVRNGYYNYIGNAYTDLILLLGDNAYDTGTDLQFQAALFENMYEDKLIQSPLWPTIGNHDMDIGNAINQLDPYFDIFTLPRNGEAGGLASGTEAYYSFDYANVHFVILDSEYGPGRDPGSPMLVWLENDLQATAQDWTIVYWHHPPYSKGSHDSDSESSLIEMRQNVLPILEANGVDLVMSGHSHSYERSFLLDGHYGPSSTLQPSMIVDNGNGRMNGDGSYQKIQNGPTPPDGAVYVVAGSSGKTSGGSLNHPVMYYSNSTLGSLSLEVTGPQLDLKFIDVNGAVLDYFTMQKSTPVGNPPAVSVSAPADGAYYNSPQLISLQAQAADSDGTITEVAFLVDGATVGIDHTAPYALDWQIPGSGNYVIQARARDNDDNYATSSPVNISAGSIQACSRINSSSDDAEEKNGSTNLSSSDLELVYDGSNQTVGMRFNNLDIPQGATITSAYIQFTVDEVRNDDPCNLNIYGQASDNPPTFSSGNSNISSRPKTNATVAWSPSTWNAIGDAGAAQQSPDIAPIIQEIVGRGGYTASSSIVILIDGTGRRTAESYNGSAGQAAQLCVEYSNGAPTFDCPSLSANIGDACNDGDNTTIDDMIGTNCTCTGTPTACTGIGDNDGDGVCLDVDCDDNDPTVTTTSANDADCDGVPTSLDCDDSDPTVTASNANDADCDGVPSSLDCDDSDPTVTASNANDADCDGVPSSLDCDDSDPTITASNANDADCDGIPSSLDCDDSDPTVTASNANDADCDGVPSSLDCDDSDPTITASNANDADCDGIPSSLDCDDSDPTVTTTSANDADCDGIPTSLDCDDSDPTITASNANDTDCDGVPSSLDCDDTDPTVTASNANDADCDGVPSSLDCDDNDPTVTASNANDADCDGVPSSLDCDDSDPTVTASNVNDADCDGVPSSLDCDDSDPTVTTTSANDADCDGVPTSLDCDDSDPTITASNTNDADCDGVPSSLDCDDTDPTVTASNANDADCDGIPTSLDCDDSDPTITASNANDADCDGVPSSLDCDDSDPTVTASNANDADCDGVPSSLDCDDSDPTVTTTSSNDADCDGVPTNLDCNDSDPTVTTTSANDADCDGVPTNLDCDDNDPTVTASNANDADCDGVPTSLDCDDTDPTITASNANDADCDGIPTSLDCDDSDPTITASNANDADCDGVPTSLDCDDSDPTITASNANDADCDGIASSLDCDDSDPTVTTTSANDADCDGVPTSLDCDDSDPTVTASNANDADCDGVPSGSDCNDNNASITTQPGDSCNDGDPSTTSDVIQSDCICRGVAAVSTACARVSASNDDAEEKSNGSVSLTSSDLELAYDGSNQTIGMRFIGLNIPQGATITNAHIQFTVDEARNDDPCNLTIFAQASNNAPAFSSSNNNISSRAQTNATVAWQPPQWTSVGASGSAQRTPDISSVIQEVVNRSGYSANSAIVVLITGTGRRTAESFNGSSADAPQLCVDYSLVPPDCPALSANIGDPCDDGDNTTINDTVDANCMCTGTPTACTGLGDIDGDGVCSNVDCDDNDLAIITGDGDGDGVCTDVDCDDSNPTIAYQPGDPCEDGDPTTFGETIQADCTCGGGGSSPTLSCSRISNGDDDAEERNSGSVNFGSSDLELVYDGSKGNQTIGLRFNGHNIPPGASIASAYIQFTVDENRNDNPCLLTIYGEDSNNAPAFANSNTNISSRPRTTATVSWQPAIWQSVGDAGPAQQTPDISAILQEIVNRSGYSASSSIVILIDGTGRRVAESFNGSSSAAPELCVEYYGASSLSGAGPLNGMATDSEDGKEPVQAFQSDDGAAANTDHISPIRVYPNPASGELWIAFTSRNEGKVRLQARNLSGQVVITEVYEVSAGHNTIALENLSLPGGIYFLQLFAGQTVQSGKFIIQQE